MRCKELEGLISPYIDNELSEEDRELFEAHLKECRECSAEYEEILAMHNAFAHSERFKAPYGFSTRVLANIESKDIGVWPWKPFFARLAGAVAILMIIGIGIGSGGFLGGSFSLQKTENPASSLSLDTFSAAPPDSLGGVYLAMTERRDEKR